MASRSDRAEQVLAAIRDRFAQEQGPSESDAIISLTEIDAELALTPEDVQLWCLRGDLIQLAPATSRYTLGDAHASYQRALSIDPASVEAHTALGFLFDAVDDDPASAEPHFRQALTLGGGLEPLLGLARVLAELGRAQEALHLLDSAGDAATPDVATLRAEIEAGVWSER